MAYVGLSNPYIAELADEAAKVYKNGFRCGKAMTLNVTPNYNEGSLYANNQLAEYIKEFKDGTMTLGTSTLPKEAGQVCFGHEIDESSGMVTYKTTDEAKYVGVGFIVSEVVDNVKKYVATIVYKVKFSEAATDFSTKGENIEFKTPSLEGKIAGLSSGEWKATIPFDTETEAEDWIKTTLGITDAAGGT